VRGDLAGLDAADITVIGVCGSLMNVILAALGWLMLRSERPYSAAARFFAWLLMTVNGFIPAVYLIVSPLLGIGDWMTIFRRYDNPWIWRGVTVIIGLVLTPAWFRLVRRTATALFSGLTAAAGNPSGRIGLVSWWSGGALAFAAALFSPLDWQWALMIAVSSTMGVTWPMLPAIQDAAGQADAGGPEPGGIGPAYAWIAAAIVASLIFVFIFGPGIRL
jgi:hypothetical protein